MNPLVSVVMPVYNSEPYLCDSIGSVLKQSMTNFELIVVDDASADCSVEIIDKMAATDSRITFISLKENRGVAEARNIALASARGHYVAFLDSDDCWEPQKLEKQLKAMEETRCPLCTCSYRMHFEDSSKRKPDWIFHVPNRISYDDLLRVNYFVTSTVVIESELVPQKMFDASLMHEDYGAWLALLRNGQEACGVDEPLAMYRVRAGSRSSNKVISAWGRWDALKRCTDEPLMRRAALCLHYAVSGLKKYGFSHE